MLSPYWSESDLLAQPDQAIPPSRRGFARGLLDFTVWLIGMRKFAELVRSVRR